MSAAWQMATRSGRNPCAARSPQRNYFSRTRRGTRHGAQQVQPPPSLLAGFQAASYCNQLVRCLLLFASFHPRRISLSSLADLRACDRISPMLCSGTARSLDGRGSVDLIMGHWVLHCTFEFSFRHRGYGATSAHRGTEQRSERCDGVGKHPRSYRPGSSRSFAYKCVGGRASPSLSLLSFS